jgi:D-alanine-D-alanine ligase
MTPLSLVPEQARHCGMSYGDLVEAIVADALANGASHEDTSDIGEGAEGAP